ncbi:DUF421 domain-containing protein [Paenibacillus spiritus]|uniref:DUF421 domain-containing protein n=2 Tax=Paenibacillus TaxID=44249 RepID=A0A5J5G2N5_9BACL|nr:DUF421 domain-containing protein [Paenibacillus spiritus]
MIAVKLVTGFVGLWVMTRLLGKKEISQLTPFDFVSSLMLSELVGNTVYQKDAHYGMLIFALGLWALLSYLFEKVTQHAKRLRSPMEGEASIVICDGKIDMEQMKRNRLDFGQLRMMLRQKDIFEMSEVAYAVFEKNGSLSVLKKSEEEPPTRGDLKVDAPEAELAYSLVEDGDVNEDNLGKIGKDLTWLLAELRLKGHNRPEDLAFVEWTRADGLFVMEQWIKEGSA